MSYLPGAGHSARQARPIESKQGCHRFVEGNFGEASDCKTQPGDNSQQVLISFHDAVLCNYLAPL